MAALTVEADTFLAPNLEALHTNPSQLSAGYGLSAQGDPAVPCLVEALRAQRWPLRAADILGDIGLAAEPAVHPLLNCLQDSSEWVRRNAVEALGVIAAAQAVPRLSHLLTNDECDYVRHNAALSLAKIGPEADVARPALEMALGEPYIDTARMKGLSGAKIYFRHALRVAINPIISSMGLRFPQIISGSTIVAIVLTLPLIGPLLLTALLREDVYLACSILVVLTLALVIGNFLADLALAWLDPRIRFES